MRRALKGLAISVLLTAACGRSDEGAPPVVRDREPPRKISFCGQSLPVDVDRIHCTDPTVSDLVELTALRSLKTITLAGTNVHSLHQLRDVGQVTHLDVSGTALTDLSSLDAKQWTSLELLSLTETKITDLGPLSALPALKTLHLNSTMVVDLSPVFAIATLADLSVADSAITRLPELPSTSALKKLDVSGTLVSDLTPIRSAPHLVELRISHTLVEDVSPLADAPSLTTLHASYTALTASSLEELRRRRPDLKLDTAPQWTGSLEMLRTVISAKPDGP